MKRSCWVKTRWVSSISTETAGRNSHGVPTSTRIYHRHHRRAFVMIAVEGKGQYAPKARCAIAKKNIKVLNCLSKGIGHAVTLLQNFSVHLKVQESSTLLKGTNSKKGERTPLPGGIQSKGRYNCHWMQKELWTFMGKSNARSAEWKRQCLSLFTSAKKVATFSPPQKTVQRLLTCKMTFDQPILLKQQS